MLGSLPSEASLKAGEYYAHPQNAFWKIMNAITGASGDYENRCQALMEAGVAVWDVLASSMRPGSMDADICLRSAVANDFATFFSLHSGMRLVCFNGRKAEESYQRLVGKVTAYRDLHFERLPSTSPAYAAMPFEEKLRRWRGIIGPELSKGRG